MNLSTRNIFVTILASVFSIYLLMPRAYAAGRCVGPMCLQCSERIFSVNAAASDVGTDNHLCDISFGNSPCDLKSTSNPIASAVITLPTNMYPQVTGHLSGFAGYVPLLFQNPGGNDKTARFHIAIDTIPIYLQNLSLLC
jgi:hypothetical protein